MNISPIDYAVSTPIKKIENAIGKDENEPAQIEQAAIPSVESAAEEIESEGKGVLRLLQEGHFKGVADIRLRINFHEQISAMEQEAIEQVAVSGVGELLQTLNGEIGSFLETDDLSPETVSGIRELSSLLNTSIEENGSVTSGQLISRLQTSFDEFASGVEALSQPPSVPDEEPPVIEAPVEQTIAVEKAAAVEVDSTDAEPIANDEISPLQKFLTDITELFASELHKLEESLLEFSLLPELSAPQGNGKAYDKFLAEYNKLTGVVNHENELSVTDSLA